MADIHMTIDAKDAIAAFADLERQMPFVVSVALNASKNHVQDALRAGIEQRFTIAPQRRRFMLRLIKRTKEDMATKTKLEARVRIAGPEGAEGRGVLLARHEAGGQQVMGRAPFYIPTKEIRPGPYSLPPRSMYPKALRLMDQRGVTGTLHGGTKGKHRKIAGVDTSAAKLRRVGLGGTFVLRPRTGSERGWGIYQRQGEGSEGLKMLWSFRTTIKLPPRLRMLETAKATMLRVWAPNVIAALERAIKTSRPAK